VEKAKGKEVSVMQSILLKMFMPIVIKILTDLMSPENLQKYGDKLFDYLEDLIKDTETDIDDKLALPVIQAIREAFNIPDND
jgi:hypothetical protein